MSVDWKISGQVSKSLDDRKRLFSDYLANKVILNVGSLSDDSLKFSQTFKNVEDASQYQIDIGQIVEVWRNDQKVFRGIVSKRRVSERVGSALQILTEVSGPWWWMTNTALAGEIADGAGNPGERVKFVLEEDLLERMLSKLIAKFIALGVPIQLGTIAAFYDLPQISLTNQSCANALSELLRWCPESFAWFDYSGALPKINIGRRSQAEIYTLTAGESGELQGYDLQPRLDLKVEEVKVNFVQRDEQWRTVFEDQGAGASTGDLPQRQIVTVSGPELGDFLPRDDFDSREWEILTGDAIPIAVNSGLQELIDAYPTTDILTSGTVSSITNWTQSGYTISTWTWAIASNLQAGYSPIKFSVEGVNSTPPDWLVKQWGILPVEYSNFVVVFVSESSFGTAFAQKVSDTMSGQGFYANNGFYALYDLKGNTGWSIPDEKIPANETSGTVYREADYGFIQPPANLANDLRTAQNWIPYEGDIQLKSDEVLESPIMGKVVNLKNTLPEHENMRAIVQGVQYFIDNGEASIELGAPQRLSIAGLVNKFRRNPQDNIVFLGQ